MSLKDDVQALLKGDAVSGLRAPETNLPALMDIHQRFGKYYSGKHIASAATAWHDKKYGDAAHEFEMARNGFQPEHSPKEWEVLEGWRRAADKKANEPAPFIPDKYL